MRSAKDKRTMEEIVELQKRTCDVPDYFSRRLYRCDLMVVRLTSRWQFGA